MCIRDRRVSALERFKDLDMVNGERVQMEVRLPAELEGKKKLGIYAVKGGKRIQWFSASAAQLQKKQGKPQYFIESIEVESGEKICRVRGWAAFDRPLTIRLEDRSRKKIPCEITRLKRVDVQMCIRDRFNYGYQNFQKMQADGGEILIPNGVTVDNLTRCV